MRLVLKENHKIKVLEELNCGIAYLINGIQEFST